MIVKGLNLHKRAEKNELGACLKLWVITARKRSLRILCFYTCLSFCPRGSLPRCMLGYQSLWDQAAPLGANPQTRHPLGAEPPWDQAPPSGGRPLGPGTPHAQCMLGDTVNKRAVCILLKCNLVCFFFFTVTDLVQMERMTFVSGKSWWLHAH